jgi:hypothetical protein
MFTVKDKLRVTFFTAGATNCLGLYHGNMLLSSVDKAVPVSVTMILGIFFETAIPINLVRMKNRLKLSTVLTKRI